MSATSVLLTRLPLDLQHLLFDLTVGTGIYTLPRRLPVRVIPIERFPHVEIGTNPTDQRGHAYVQRMINADLPPLVIVGEHWIDGRHRIAAHRLMQTKSVPCIDLVNIIPVPTVPYLGTLIP